METEDERNRELELEYLTQLGMKLARCTEEMLVVALMRLRRVKETSHDSIASSESSKLLSIALDYTGIEAKVSNSPWQESAFSFTSRTKRFFRVLAVLTLVQARGTTGTLPWPFLRSFGRNAHKLSRANLFSIFRLHSLGCFYDKMQRKIDYSWGRFIHIEWYALSFPYRHFL